MIIIEDPLPTPSDLCDVALKWVAEQPHVVHLHVHPDQLERAKEIVARRNANAPADQHIMKAVADTEIGPNSWYICWAPFGSKSTDP